MKQYFVHIQKSYYDELVQQIEIEIAAHNDEGFVLVDIQYFNMENDSSQIDAFLLFNECKVSLYE